MSAKVIDLADYRRKKLAEKNEKKLRGLGFPDDFSPFSGPDDQPEDFGMLGIFSGLRNVEFNGPEEKDKVVETITSRVTLTEEDKIKLRKMLDD